MGTSTSSSRAGERSSARLLAHVGARLTAAADREYAASFVTGALVPELADAASIVVVDPKGQSRQLAIHAAGPEAARLIDAGKDCYPNALNDESEPHIASIGFPASETGARHSAGSCLVAALRSDERVRGVLVLVRSGEKPFTADDRETA